jgi:hypothetical protein
MPKTDTLYEVLDSLVDKTAPGFSHESPVNKSVEWYTPKYIFDMLGIEFDLDPCHPETRIPWIPAKQTFSLKDDGLAQPWHGNVWLNPPYGKHTPDWLAKMHRHRHGIALVFARTDCKWFHDYVAKADAILFLKGRIKFVDGLGVTAGGGPGSGSMLIAWGQDNVQVLESCSNQGFLVVTDF